MKTTSFTNKLKGYSALAGSVLAMHSADAQIIYTNINPDKVLGGTIPDGFPVIDTSDLDLNNDGVFDYRAKLEILGPNKFGSWDQEILFYGLNTAGGDFNRVLMTYTGSSDAHVNIPYQGGMLLGAAKESFFARGDIIGIGIGSYGAGLFWGKEAYLGVELKNNGQNYFGWVRVALAPSPTDTPRLVLKDYAFNAKPGEPILSGQRIANACPDPFETKWFSNTIPSIQFGSANHALISPEGDSDLYKISVVAGTPNVRAVLSNLPKNYNLFLLNSSFGVVAKSANPGLMNDTVIANNLSAGTYYLEVRAGKKKYQPDKCYSLIAEASAIAYREIELSSGDVINRLQAYPNPADNLLIVTSNNIPDDQSKLSIYDVMGKLVLTAGKSSREPDGSIHINISSLPEGSYLLQMESKDIARVTRFIVQH